MLCEHIHLKDYFPFLGEEGRDPVLTTYLPQRMGEESGKRLAILICPGGAYENVSPREAEPVALNLMSEGFNVFVLTYSVAPHRFPAQLREVAAAMEIIHRNADRWETDAHRIAMMGFSAGGHLAAHYSCGYDCDQVREKLPESFPVKASVLCYPVISARPDCAHVRSIENVTGESYPLCEETMKKFSCDELVTDKTPPAFLWHTAEDAVVPVANSLRYAAALSAHQIPVEMHIYPAGPHGLSTVDQRTCITLNSKVCRAHEWLREVAGWLKEYL